MKIECSFQKETEKAFFLPILSGYLNNTFLYKKQNLNVIGNIKAFKSGVGGFRTLVQTTRNLAFYMLILRLFFDVILDKDTHKLHLSSESRTNLEASLILS